MLLWVFNDEIDADTGKKTLIIMI
ncbi:hypothetical protein MNBD_GAMMA01-1956, partial [hydrothermal vent metagenome]